MRANGGRRIVNLACCLTLAVLAAGCSSDETPKKAADAPATEPDVSVGGGSADTGAVSSGGGRAGALPSLASSAGVRAGVGGVSPGLSVRGTAAGPAPADLAFVVVVPPPRGASDFLTSGSMSP